MSHLTNITEAEESALALEFAEFMLMLSIGDFPKFTLEMRKNHLV